METLTLPDGFHLLFFVGLMFLISEAAGNLANGIGLPRMIGYILSGIMCGPYLLGWYDQQLIEVDMAFFQRLARALIS